MRFRVWVQAGLLLALWGGCARRVEVQEAPEPATASLEAYYPLAVGNRWTYRLNGREDKEVVVEVLREEEGYFLDNQGGQLTVDGFGIRDRKRYLLRGPLREGQGWTNVVSVSSTERYRLLQVGVACQSPAGRFQDCVRVEGRNRADERTTLINTLTFAPGVGLVRVETVAEVGSQIIPQTWLELVSYQVQPVGR
jgi:hypothetical protein